MNDVQGNELAVGDPIHVKLGNEWILANVVKIRNGGIAVTGMPKNAHDPVGVTPDALVIQLGVVFNQQPPGSRHMTVMKVVAPNMVHEVVESSIKM